MKINTIYLSAIIVFICLITSVKAQVDRPKILVLNSYHKGFSWTDNIVTGIESVLRSEESDFEIVVEYMDTKTIGYGPEYRQILHELYEYKYQKNDFKLIISSDDNAFNFLKDYHEELFPGVPIVFCGLNNSDAPNLVDNRQFTGVLETTAPKETIDLILKLHPETKKIILIIDKTPSGEYRWKMIQPILRNFEHIEFIRISDDYSLTTIEQMLGGLAKDTVSIFFSLYRDQTGKYLSVRESVSRVTQASSRPVYTTHLLELPYGVVGGKVLGGFQHGMFAATIANRILHGEEVGSIPFVKTSPTQYVFNFAALNQWGIKFSDLPDNSVILNEPFSFYKDYKLIIWSVASFITLLIVIVFVLQLNVLRRKRAEQRLIHSQKLLNKSQEISHLGSWHLDIKNNVLIWSDEQYRIFGLIPEEFGASYDAFLNTIHPDDREMVDKTYSDSIKNNLPYECVHRIIRPNGDIRVVHEKSEDVVDENGETIHSYGFTQDITLIKAAEASLKENERKFRNLLESTSIVPWELDLESSVFTYMGHQIEQLLGYPLASWKDLNVWKKRLHPEDKEEAVQFCEIETKKGRDHDFTYRAIHMDGSIRWIRDIVSVVFDSGKPKKLIGFMQDISVQKNMELEQKQMEIKLQHSQKLEAIGTLAGGIAHDFNNILSAVIGYAEMARESISSENAIAHDLDQVLGASYRARDLVQQILSFSRQSNTECISFVPARLVKEALKMLRSTIPSTIKIVQDIDSYTGSIFADPTHINQIMMNLFTNGYHALEKEGGELGVSLKEVDVRDKDILHEHDVDEGVFVKNSVWDTGQGIPSEIIGNIFNPFFTTKETGKGTGMGLSIVHGIVKNYGGFISVESKVDEGTTFNVFLPVHEKVEPSEEAHQIDQVKGGKERILFIDDEEILAHMSKKVIERLGYTVYTKNNSFDALKTFQDNPDQFDLVVTDQTMPGMTGLDLSQRMLQIRPDIPIIICTGYSTAISKEKVQRYGIKEFALKPLSRNDFARLIRKVLDGE